MANRVPKPSFRVEDVTFRNARKQSRILDEMDYEEKEVEDIKAPVSVTPEQVIDFYKAKISSASDSNEKRVYSTTIMWIEELQRVKKENVSLKEKEIARQELDSGVDDLVDEGV